MGKAKRVFETLKIRTQMERHYRLPAPYSKNTTKGTRSGLSATSMMSADISDIALPADAFEQMVSFETAWS